MTNQKRYFAEIMHDVLIVLLVTSMILIAQRINKTVYQLGVLGLVASTFVQIGFGNIPPATELGRSLKLLGIALGLLFSVFALGILLAPLFIGLTRG